MQSKQNRTERHRKRVAGESTALVALAKLERALLESRAVAQREAEAVTGRARLEAQARVREAADAVENELRQLEADRQAQLQRQRGDRKRASQDELHRMREEAARPGDAIAAEIVAMVLPDPASRGSAGVSPALSAPARTGTDPSPLEDSLRLGQSRSCGDEAQP